MQNVVCFKHPTYDGSSSPQLSCKACCGIFLTEIRRQNAAASATLDPMHWLEEKARQAREAVAKVQARYGLNP